MVAVSRVNNTVTLTGLVGTNTAGTVNTTQMQSLSYIVDPTAAGTANSAFTYPTGTGSAVTVAANSLATGQIVTVTVGTAQTLPIGLGTGTNYYAIPTGTLFEFASSYANAVSGTAIALSNNGTADTNAGTIVPTGLSATLQEQVQNASSNWVNYGTSQTITSGTSLIIENDVTAFSNARLQIVVAAGQLNVNVSTNAKQQSN